MPDNPTDQDAIGEPVTELDQFWLDTARTAVKESVSSLEEAAKQLIGAVTLVEGIYFAAVSWSDMKTIMAVSGWESWLRNVAANLHLRQPRRLVAGLSRLCDARLHPRDLPDQLKLSGPCRAVPPGPGQTQAQEPQAGPPGPSGRLRSHAGGGGGIPAAAGRAGISAPLFSTAP